MAPVNSAHSRSHVAAAGAAVSPTTAVRLPLRCWGGWGLQVVTAVEWLALALALAHASIINHRPAPHPVNISNTYSISNNVLERQILDISSWNYPSGPWTQALSRLLSHGWLLTI